MATTPLSKYIRNKNINIPETIWLFFTEVYSKDEITGWLADHILEGDIRLPLIPISEDAARADFDKLCSYSVQPPIITNDACTRYTYEKPFSGVIISEGQIGMKASNYFQQWNRFQTDHQRYSGPATSWSNRKDVLITLKALWSMKYDCLDMMVLYHCLALRRYIASQFRPSVAKSLYIRYDAHEIYDPSMGWGDRLVAAAATSQVTKYIGTDPSPLTFPKYLEQVEFYKRFMSKDMEFELYNLPAEELQLQDNCVDYVFTSPPYFNAENYCKDDKQSFMRYSTSEAWLNNFLYPSLTNAWKALKPGGHLSYNISDICGDSKEGVLNEEGRYVIKICDPMCRFIENELGGEFVEFIGMRLSKRPNCHSYDGKTGTSYEPIFTFKKN